MQTQLLDWYGSRPGYPWRARPTPYRVLVSEVMLQQTQAGRVVPVFRRFVGRFPSVRDLATAPRADVIRAWAGLGYNRRAVRLHEAAHAIVRDHRGRVPRDLDALGRLPGVGPYTAAAVASIAFGMPVPAIDVNVARVVARHRLGREPHEGRSRDVEEAARAWIAVERPGDWNQAVMDLGRVHCRATPRCAGCPLAGDCAFRRSGRAPAPRPGGQGRFEGSRRQLRGAIVHAVRSGPRSLGALVRSTGRPLDEVAEAIRGLATDGLLAIGPAAAAGDPRGRVRLPGPRSQA